MTGGMLIYLCFGCFLTTLVIISVMAKNREVKQQKAEEGGCLENSIRLVVSPENYRLLKAAAETYGVGLESFITQNAVDKASDALSRIQTARRSLPSPEANERCGSAQKNPEERT